MDEAGVRFSVGPPTGFCDIISVRKLFLSVASDRTHIGTYVGVMPPLASNENNLEKKFFKIFFWRIFFV